MDKHAVAAMRDWTPSVGDVASFVSSTVKENLTPYLQGSPNDGSVEDRIWHAHGLDHRSEGVPETVVAAAFDTLDGDEPRMGRRHVLVVTTTQGVRVYLLPLAGASDPAMLLSTHDARPLPRPAPPPCSSPHYTADSSSESDRLMDSQELLPQQPSPVLLEPAPIASRYCPVPLFVSDDPHTASRPLIAVLVPAPSHNTPHLAAPWQIDPVDRARPAATLRLVPGTSSHSHPVASAAVPTTFGRVGFGSDAVQCSRRSICVATNTHVLIHTSIDLSFTRAIESRPVSPHHMPFASHYVPNSPLHPAPPHANTPAASTSPSVAASPQFLQHGMPSPQHSQLSCSPQSIASAFSSVDNADMRGADAPADPDAIEHAASPAAPFCLSSRWLAFATVDTPAAPAAGTATTYLETAGTVAKDVAVGLAKLTEKSLKFVIKEAYYLTQDPQTSTHIPSPTAGRTPEAGDSSGGDHAGLSTRLRDADGCVKVVDVVTGEVVVHFRAHHGRVRLLRFDHSGTMLATVCEAGRAVHVYRLVHRHEGGGGDVMHTHHLVRGATRAHVVDLAFSPDNTHVTAVTSRGTTHVFRLRPFPAPQSTQPSPSSSSPASSLPSPWPASLLSNGLSPTVTQPVLCRVREASVWDVTRPAGLPALAAKISLESSTTASAKAATGRGVLTIGRGGTLLRHTIVVDDSGSDSDVNAEVGIVATDSTQELIDHGSDEPTPVLDGAACHSASAGSGKSGSNWLTAVETSVMPRPHNKVPVWASPQFTFNGKRCQGVSDHNSNSVHQSECEVLEVSCAAVGLTQAMQSPLEFGKIEKLPAASAHGGQEGNLALALRRSHFK